MAVGDGGAVGEGGAAGERGAVELRVGVGPLQRGSGREVVEEGVGSTKVGE